jgi:hypothetical protein
MSQERLLTTPSGVDSADVLPIPAFAIVPVRALPAIAAVLLLLIAAVATNTLWALNFFHVAFGGAWTALELFVGFVIGPILGRLSPSARIEFSIRFMPRMLVVMPTLVTVTLVSGWQLAARNFGYINLPYPQHWWLTASFVVVGLMAVIALGFLEPANLAVLFELRKPRPDVALVGRLMRRFAYTAGITGILQLAILLIMTHLRVL